VSKRVRGLKFPRRTDRPSRVDRLLEHGWTVILYDGECELCSAIVKFIVHRSRNSLLAFSAIKAASFQIERGRDNAARAYQTIFVLEGSQVLESGDAVIRLLRKMDRPWSALAVVARIAPRIVRDFVYRFVARNRYRVFGRRQSCLFCVPDEGRRFVR
jgi:predicted DCC family thiol-disulfide oxidoreductase YuxK